MSDASPPASRSAAFPLPVILLVAANLVPLVGIFAWGWRVFDVVVLYWVENVIVGGFNLLKMLICSPDPAQVDFRAGQEKPPAGSPAPSDAQLAAVHQLSKLFFMPFFTIHYGIFTLVHGMFVFSMLGGRDNIESAGPFRGFGQMLSEVTSGGGLWAVLALVASHLVSFVHHFLIQGEYRRATVMILMVAPYGRVAVLHVAILGGAFAIQALGSPVVLLVILIAGKIAIDLTLHRRSHRKLGELCIAGK